MNPGSGGGGRQKLNSVLGGLDDFGLEHLVSNSNKDNLRVLRRRALWSRQPRGLPKQLCPEPLFTSSVSGFLGSPAAPGAMLWLVVFGFGVYFGQFLSFCFAFPVQPQCRAQNGSWRLPWLWFMLLPAAPFSFQGSIMLIVSIKSIDSGVMWPGLISHFCHILVLAELSWDIHMTSLSLSFFPIKWFLINKIVSAL